MPLHIVEASQVATSSCSYSASRPVMLFQRFLWLCIFSIVIIPLLMTSILPLFSFKKNPFSLDSFHINYNNSQSYHFPLLIAVNGQLSCGSTNSKWDLSLWYKFDNSLTDSSLYAQHLRIANSSRSPDYVTGQYNSALRVANSTMCAVRDSFLSTFATNGMVRFIVIVVHDLILKTFFYCFKMFQQRPCACL